MMVMEDIDDLISELYLAANDIELYYFVDTNLEKMIEILQKYQKENK